jgi:predicted glycosyltransferase
VDFHPEPTELISCADRIVSMGGYNTISEILSLGKHALIVPRIHPRREQMIRATRLKELGLVDLAHPEMVNRGVIADWLSTAHTTFRHAGNLIDFKGLSRVPQLLHDMLTETGRHSARSANL